MTLNELIEKLNDARDELGGDANVQIIYQQNYPLCAKIHGVSFGSGDDDGNEENDEKVVYICQGEPTGYGSSDVWNNSY